MKTCVISGFTVNVNQLLSNCKPSSTTQPVSHWLLLWPHWVCLCVFQFHCSSFEFWGYLWPFIVRVKHIESPLSLWISLVWKLPSFLAIVQILLIEGNNCKLWILQRNWQLLVDRQHCKWSHSNWNISNYDISALPKRTWNLPKKGTFLLISGQVNDLNDLNRSVSWFGWRYPVQLNGVKTRSKPHKLLFMPNFNSQEGVPVKTARFLWALRFFTHNFKTFTTNFLLNGFSSFLRCPMFSIFMVPCDDGDGHNHCSDDCDHQYRIQKTMWFEWLVQVYCES